MIRRLAPIDAPILRHSAHKVVALSQSYLRELVGDLIDTMRGNGSYCLAAPQIGVPLRVIVFETHADTPAGPVREVKGLINPVILFRSGSTEGFEACANLPGHVGRVWRAREIRCSALDFASVKVMHAARGREARAIQHAVDHLDGGLYIDKANAMCPCGAGGQEEEGYFKG
ncbi:peptide deformylase [Burkholderia gladioli]|uniref:peptide deformylase n=1 Tax=Burkholderia gladioli TaxID=28095 RepID=UPI0016417B16|nr:peptide deformylase [Burkholderia gladioli]